MKPNTVIRIGQWFYYLLMAVSVVVAVVFYISNRNVNPDDPVHTQMNDLGPILNSYVFWAYILVGLAAFFTIIFPLVRMVTNPKSGLKTLISIVIVAAILIIAYQLGSDKILNIPGYEGKFNQDPWLKISDMGIFTMYVLLAGAILSMFFSAVKQLIKK